MSDLPVLIIGAGVSGLLLAQHLKKQGVLFEIFERDTSFTTRGVGWGLTLHWSLDPLKSLLPDDLVQKLPYAFADRISVENGVHGNAPYYDLSTAATIGTTPGTDLKVRVTRQRLRVLLATGLDVQWGKSFHSFEDRGDRVAVTFDDGEVRLGRLLVGADGASSRIRRQLHPQHGTCYHLPVNVLGMKLSCTAEECETMRKCDPFYFSAIASKNDSFMYFSILDAPGSNEDSGDKYGMQVSVSWEQKAGFLGREKPLQCPESQQERHELLREIATTWQEPWKSFALSIPKDTDIQLLIVQDFIPPVGFRQRGRVTMLGDSVHAMAMYRGEGANHAIYDIYEFSMRVTSHLTENLPELRMALDDFEDIVANRTRPAVMASRRACLDAHNWTRVTKESPLFLKREPWVDFDESRMA